MPEITPLTPDQEIALGLPTKLKQLNPTQVQTYLTFLTTLWEEKKINLHLPSSLLRTHLYETLSEQDQGALDQAAMVLVGNLRMLRSLVERAEHETYQAEHYVEAIWKYKEKFEDLYGDIFLI